MKLGLLTLNAFALWIGDLESQHAMSGPTPIANSTDVKDGDDGRTPPNYPLRHPRPMTVADLHLEMEKEQEAVVNRLTRELSLLRQQTASVASTASSASTNVNDLADHQQGPILYNPRSRNRSSSTLSSRSFAGATSLPIGSVSGITPSREGGAPSRQSLDYHRGNASHEPSIASRAPSGHASPALSSSFQQHGEHFMPSSHPHSHSYRLSQTFLPAPGSSGQTQAPREGSRRGSLSATHAAARYEEVSTHRAELEATKRENEMLRRRVRELEATIREYRRSEAGGRTRISEATSTLTAGLRAASISNDQ
ncbi:hypothetical protein CPC735_073230 [Coccidioides posadasii C735 delta SOWgp]|uniref:Uncharacterized protein n=1 Tax=Coccidioides posadasii (strain C735) TaxID=222929 RepID=C5P1T3_COCP7|nr:hypothetical protein CPC735_073230 [Coccidioides posadasii C735 delta SOWgp]EER29641.1 hypothetical protein CPC735_073230 [Coccidioides posadasii C735 delta SOWgp]|eukprot:XP_003071786.1 hypothetical protein CPC735_073230 [Coccidioides posadasii C735 delta SOWgp]